MVFCAVHLELLSIGILLHVSIVTVASGSTKCCDVTVVLPFSRWAISTKLLLINERLTNLGASFICQSMTQSGMNTMLQYYNIISINIGGIKFGGWVPESNSPNLTVELFIS